MFILKFSIAVAVVVLLFNAGAGYAERQECRAWAKKAAADPGYTIKPWQAKQCLYHGLAFEARVQE